MSHSHYRGKLHTNAEVKGPFTEAKDDFSVAFDLLEGAIFRTLTLEQGDGPEVKAWFEGNTIFLCIGDITLSLQRKGIVEISEGAA